jgi:YHS domain-containing protein
LPGCRSLASAHGLNFGFEVAHPKNGVKNQSTGVKINGRLLLNKSRRTKRKDTPMKQNISPPLAAFAIATFLFACGMSSNAAEQSSGMHHGKGATAAAADGAKAAPIAFDKKPSVGTEATCPVSGEKFKVTADTQFSQYKGKYYGFCCPGCKPQFDKDPEKFVKK